jgi:predicted GNAT superfamily acetyltransferase
VDRLCESRYAALCSVKAFLERQGMSNSRFTIAPADATDLPKIAALAGARRLGANSTEPTPSDGFLVSNFTLEDYRKFQQQARHLQVARIDAQFAGFLLAFADADPVPRGSVDRWLAENCELPFLVVKQVCVDVSFTRQGVASRLYESVLQAHPQRRLFAAIVLDPPNPGSVKFHEQLGFGKLCEIDADDGLRRGVWSREPFAHEPIQESAR